MGEISGKSTRHRHSVRPVTRGVVRALGLLGSAQGVGMLCSLIRNKLVATWIGPSGIALVGILNSAVEMIGALAQQGIRTSAVGEAAAAARTPRMPQMAAVIDNCGLLVGIAGAVIMLLLAPWLSRLSFGNYGYSWSFIIVAGAVALNSFIASRQAIAQATGSLARIAAASLTGSAAGLLLSVPLIYFLRLQGLAWVIVVYSAVTAVAYLWPPLRIDGTRLPHVGLRDTLRESSRLLRLGIWLTLSSAIDWGVSYLFMSWLHAYGGDTAVGLYQSGYTVAVRYVGVLFSAIAMEFYPRLSTRVNRSPRHPALLIAHETGVVLRIAFPAVAILILLGRYVMTLLYSSDFADATMFMSLAAAATPLRALSWCTAFLIIARGDGRTYLLVELASGILCLALSVSGYFCLGLTGIGIGFIVWYLLYSLIVVTVTRRRYGLQLPAHTVIASLSATAVLTAIAFIC